MFKSDKGLIIGILENEFLQIDIDLKKSGKIRRVKHFDKKEIHMKRKQTGQGYEEMLKFKSSKMQFKISIALYHVLVYAGQILEC